MKLTKDRKELLKILPKNIIFAEVGVFEGQFSQEIKQIINPSKLYLVDIFSGNAGSGDKDGANWRHVNLNQTLENLKIKYLNDKCIRLIKNMSANFLNSLQDNYLDGVYIDADHSYDAVKKDLYISYDKVKNNGFILGHDYHEQKFNGVFKAVNDFCKDKNLEIEYLTEDLLPSFLIINKK
jgi:hypothetical protein